MSALKFSHHFVPHHHPSHLEGQEGEHHRAHALNQRALLGYAFIFFITIAGFNFVKNAAPQILGTAQFTAGQIVELTNAKRAEQGLGPLVYNSLLTQAAQAKAGDMYANNYWAHYSPQGKSPWNFIVSAGYKYIYAGENLARDFNDPGSLVDAWMASPTHRSNILDKNFKEIGVSVSDGSLTGREGVLVVQMFGSAVSQVPAQVAQAPKASEPLAQLPNQRETQGESRGESSEVVVETPLASASASAVSVNGPELRESATVLASRQFSISKMFSLALVGFVFSLFALEVAVAAKKSHITVKSSTLAHLGMLALVLFALWYAVSGSVI